MFELTCPLACKELGCWAAPWAMLMVFYSDLVVAVTLADINHLQKKSTATILTTDECVSIR